MTTQPSSTQVELDRYFERIEQRLPQWLGRSLRWLRKPSALPARIVASLLLIAGGLVGFLPILGFWMLPLGLIIIAQDLPFLQRPLLSALKWVEERIERHRRR